MDPMLGMIYLVPFNWAPSGYLMCQGQSLSISQYQALFTLLGTTYGGNGSQTFGLPNLQGRVPLGFGTSASGTSYPLGQAVGTEKATLSVANLPTHAPSATFTPTTGSQSVTIPATTGNLTVGVTVNATGNLAANAVPSSTNAMLSAASGSTKLYGPTATSNLVPLAGTSASVTGTASTAASSVNVTTVTGGSVTIAPVGGNQPVSTLPPVLALNFIIAMQGIYPSRP